MGEGTVRPRLGSYARKVSPAPTSYPALSTQHLAFVVGLMLIDSSVDSLAGMKNALPGLRKRLNSDPVYFKQVYMHTFDLAKPEGARTLPIDTGKPLSSLRPVWSPSSRQPRW